MCDKLMTFILGGDGGLKFDRGLWVLADLMGEFWTDDVTLDDGMPRELVEAG